MTDTIKPKKRTDVLTALETILYTAETLRQSYFWNPPATARQRRAEEFSREYVFLAEGKRWHVEQQRKNSCQNVYFNQTIRRDGERTTLLAIRNLRNRLHAQLIADGVIGARGGGGYMLLPKKARMIEIIAADPTAPPAGVLERKSRRALAPLYVAAIERSAPIRRFDQE